jgi:hypothetical protein
MLKAEVQMAEEKTPKNDSNGRKLQIRQYFENHQKSLNSCKTRNFS